MLKLLKLPDKLFKYLAAAILILVPLYPKFPFIKIAGTYVAVRLEDFLIVIIGVVTVVGIIPKLRMILKNEIVRAIMIFLAIGVLSLISGIFLTGTVVPSIGILHLTRRIEYFVPFFFVLVFFLKAPDKNLGFYLKTLLLVMAAVFIYALGQKYFRFPVIITQNEEHSKGAALFFVPGSHIISTFAGHYDLAAYVVLILPIFVSLFFTYKDKLSKFLIALASLFGFWLLVNSLSRVSLISFVVGVSVALFLMQKYKAILIVILISFVLSAFSSNLYARYRNIFDVVVRKVTSMVEVKAQESVIPVKKEDLREATPVPIPVFEDRSTSIRLNVEWPRAIRALSKNPALGTGYSSISLATDNDYLRLLGEVGVLGFFGFMLIIFRIFSVFYKALPLTSVLSGEKLAFVAGITGGIVGTLLNAVFIDVFEASKFALTFWLMVGFAVCMVLKERNDQKI